MMERPHATDRGSVEVVDDVKDNVLAADALAQHLFAAARAETPSDGAEGRAVDTVASRVGQGEASEPSPGGGPTAAGERASSAGPGLRGRGSRGRIAAWVVLAAAALVGAVVALPSTREASEPPVEAAQADERKNLQAEVVTTQAQVRRARNELSTAQDESARAQAQLALDEAMQKEQVAVAKIRAATVRSNVALPPSVSVDLKAACTCVKMDPLCGCVP